MRREKRSKGLSERSGPWTWRLQHSTNDMMHCGRIEKLVNCEHIYPEVDRLSSAAGIHAVVPKSKAATHLVAQAEALIA